MLALPFGVILGADVPLLLAMMIVGMVMSNGQYKYAKLKCQTAQSNAYFTDCKYYLNGHNVVVIVRCGT